MIITPLGHTEFLVDIKNSHSENVRILVDSWLSGFSVWDLMERRCDVVLDAEKIQTLDVIYLSHSHTDHLDPYTLLEIYRYNSPILVIPMTLQYLIPLFTSFLGNIQIEILFPDKPYVYRWITFTGYMFAETEVTNEGDVMTIALENETELLFAEIDTMPEEDNRETQEKLFQIFTKKEYSVACYLASRNELAWDLKALDLWESKRKAFRSEYIAERKEAMYFSYQKHEYEDFSDFPQLYRIPHFVRGFIWQGICYPNALSRELSELQLFPLPEIASMEADIARECGYEFPQKSLLPGRQYILENGQIETGRKDCPIGEIVKRNTLNVGDWKYAHKRIYAVGPLFPRDTLNLPEAKSRILHILNTRFLPYWSAHPLSNLRSALIKHSGAYRILFKTRDEKASFACIYTLEWEMFDVVDTVLENSSYDEVYWLEDILDFLDGRQELYSNFWHALDPRMTYRLWICLGANFCNHDLIIKKYRLHFERAVRGETSEEYFQKINF